MPDIPWQALLGGGPWALVALAVVSVIRGWLVPASTVELLRAAWEAERQARAVQAEQMTLVLEYVRTADAVLRSLPTAPPAQRETTS